MGCAASTLSRKKIYDSPEELDLVSRAKRGDQDAFNVLHATHHTRVVATIIRIVKDADTAEWLANEAMKNMWLGLPKFQEQAKFSTWITRIATNAALMWLRKEKKRTGEVPLESTLPIEESSNYFYAERWVATRDLALEGIADRDLLERAFAKVPEQFQDILRMRLFEELSLEEIQVRMSVDEPALVSKSSVKSRILRGRRMLMEQIEQLS
jgi:RNA polymerase sigma-70 factor, ECF subfamily